MTRFFGQKRKIDTSMTDGTIGEENVSARNFTFALAVLFGLVALFPDEKLVRLKLLAFELGIFGLLLVWLLNTAWKARCRWRWDGITAGVAVWMIHLLLRGIGSDYPALASTEIRRALLAFGAFLAGSQLVQWPQGAMRVWKGWGWGAGMAALYGVLQFGGGAGPLMVPQQDRVMSTFGNPIFLGTYLSVSIPLLAGLLTLSSRKTEKCTWGIVLTLSLWALYLTRTRAAWVGLAAGGLLALWSVMNPGRKRRLIFSIVLLGIGGFVGITRDVWSRDQAHGLIWRDTVKLWGNHPLWGVGPGEFHIHFPSAAGEDLKAKWPQNQFIVNYAHNEFLQVLAETGLIGFVLWIGPFILFYFRGRSPPDDREETRSSSSINHSSVLALKTSVATALVQSFFSVDMRFAVSTGLVYFLLGQGTSSRAAWREFSWRSSPSRRCILVLLVLGGAGVFSAQRGQEGWRANLLGIFQWRPNLPQESWVFLAQDMKAGFLAKLIHPYAAQYRRQRTPDFFDVRLLDPAKTLHDLEALSEQYPDEPAVFEKLGYAYAKEIRATGENGPAVIRGDMARQAITAYQRVVELDPGRAGAYNNLGNIFFTLGNRPKALEHWAASVRVNPDQADARLNLGKVFYLEGRLKEAADQFRQALVLDPGNDEATIYLKKMVE